MTQISAQNENCTLKEVETKCMRDNECCSSCCRGGVCSHPGGCFEVCKSTSNLGKEGPAVCGLVMTMNNFANIYDNVTEEVMLRLIPALHLVENFFRMILVKPMKTLSQLPETIKSILELFSLGKSVQEVMKKEFINIRRMISYLTQLFFALLISPLRGN